MRKSLIKKVVGVLLASTMFVLAACNTEIKVSYDYNIEECVTLGDYKSFTATVDTTSIVNSFMDKRIANDQEANITYNEVSRGAKDTDQVTVTYNASIGGETITGFSNNGDKLVLGKDEFVIDGFLDALYDMKAGDKKVVTLMVPENFEQEVTYAGKRIVYDITMDKVEQANVPMVTDAYVKEFFNVDTVDEYKKKIQADMQSEIDIQIKKAKEEAILTQVQSNSKVNKRPDTLYNTKKEDLRKSILMYASAQGLGEDTYCQKQFGMSFDEYVNKAVDQQLIMEAIIKAEKLVITEYEYKGELENFANQLGFGDKDDFEKKYGKDTIVKAMLTQKAQDVIMNNANIIEK